VQQSERMNDRSRPSLRYPWLLLSVAWLDVVAYVAAALALLPLLARRPVGARGRPRSAGPQPAPTRVRPETHPARPSRRAAPGLLMFDPGSSMNWREHIATDPDVLGGKPAVRGTRIAVRFVLELVDSGWTSQQIIDNYPSLTVEDIQACRLWRLEPVLQRMHATHGDVLAKLRE
jgi:uncharacterized protein (DUF433 family)